MIHTKYHSKIRNEALDFTRKVDIPAVGLSLCFTKYIASKYQVGPLTTTEIKPFPVGLWSIILFT